MRVCVCVCVCARARRGGGALVEGKSVQMTLQVEDCFETEP